MGTRDRIIDAAEQTIREYGIAGATTKRIAVRAECSEALIYKHFAGKEQLLIAVLLERAPALAPALRALRATLGQGELSANVTAFAQAALDFYRAAMPIAGGLAGDPALVSGFKLMLKESGAGPHLPIRLLADHLSAEQRLERLPPDADPEAMADLLMGACFHRANLMLLVDLPADGYAKAVAEQLLRR